MCLKCMEQICIFDFDKYNNITALHTTLLGNIKYVSTTSKRFSIIK